VTKDQILKLGNLNLSGIVTLLVSEFGLLWNCWQLGGVMVRNGLMNTGQWI